MEELIRKKVTDVLNKCFIRPKVLHIGAASALDKPLILLEDEVEFANTLDKVMEELGWKLYEVDDSERRILYVYKLKPAP